MAVKHLFTSPKTDGADDTIVQAGDWNDDHTHEAEAANKVFAGPASGANAAPTFRTLVTADIPGGADHALLSNLDYASAAHTGFLAADGTVVGATSQAQDFGSNGIKADLIVESTAAAGVLFRSTTNFPDHQWEFTADTADPMIWLVNTTAGGRDWGIGSAGTGSGQSGRFRIRDNTSGASIAEPFNIDSAGVVRMAGDVEMASRIAINATIVSTERMRLLDTGTLTSATHRAVIYGGDVTLANTVDTYQLQEIAAFVRLGTAGQTVADIQGQRNAPVIDNSSGGNVTVTNLGLNIAWFRFTSAAGTLSVTRADGFLVRSPSYPGSGLAITDLAGLRIVDIGNSQVTASVAVDIEAQTGSGTLRSIRVLGSAVSIHQPAMTIGGTGAPSEALDVTGNIAVSGTVDGVDIAARDHAKYTDAEAITAVEGEATVVLSGTLTATSYGGITEGNLLDKTANESIGGEYTFSNNIFLTSLVGIDYNPGSDTDTDIITVGVTGAPTLLWNEGQDNFSFSHDVRVIGTLIATAGLSMLAGTAVLAGPVTCTSISVTLSAGNSALIDQSSTTSAVPVLNLDQADIDDTFINYIGASAADGSRSISSDVTEDAAKFGAIRCEINGVTKWIRVYDDHS